MKDVCFTIEDEVCKSKKNIFLDLFDKASIGFNENNTDIIANEINDIYTKYKLTRQGLRNADKTTNYYKETHEDNNYRAYSKCNELYKKCINGTDGYTSKELYKAIVKVKLRNDFILQFLTSAIVDVVKVNNPKIRKFYKGVYLDKDGAEIINIGNQTYTRVFEFIDDNKVEESIQYIRSNHIQKELEKNSNAIVIRFKADTVDLNNCKECTAIKNKDGYSYSLIIDGITVVNKSYLYKDGESLNKEERIDLINIEFKRRLSKNDEYICKSV